MAEDSGATTIDVLANDEDVDGDSLTITEVTQPDNGSVTITNAGADLTYTPEDNYCNDGDPTDDFTYTISDGNGEEDTATAAVTVTCVNDAPVNSVPGAQSTAEDTDEVFTGASALSVADVDVLETPGGELKVTLSVTNGTLSLGDASQVDFSCLGCAGDGTNDASLTFTGTPAEINAALAGTAFHPTLNFNGSATLTIVTNDQGNTGAGGAKSDTDTVDITVNAVNDAPVNSVPGAQSTAEDTDEVFTGANGT